MKVEDGLTKVINFRRQKPLTVLVVAEIKKKNKLKYSVVATPATGMIARDSHRLFNDFRQLFDF